MGPSTPRLAILQAITERCTRARARAGLLQPTVCLMCAGKAGLCFLVFEGGGRKEERVGSRVRSLCCFAYSGLAVRVVVDV